MAYNQSDNSGKSARRLSAQDIYQLTLGTLQSYFKLDREGCQYDEQGIWDVVIAASAERETVETMCDVLEDSPSANTARNAVKGVLPVNEKLDDLEATLNEMLVDRLPKNLLKRSLRSAVDLVLIPYHDSPEKR